VSEHLVGNSKDGLFLLVVRKETTEGEHAFQGGRSPREGADSTSNVLAPALAEPIAAAVPAAPPPMTMTSCD
jgi:hypothetical protein